MHSSYSHFSWFCYPDSFKLHPTIQYTHQLRLPAKKNILTITSPLLNLSGNLPTQCSKPPIFKLTGFNLKKKIANSHDQPLLQGSASQPNTGANSALGERTKYLCAFPVRSHKVGSHSYRNSYHDSYQMSIRTTQQRSVFFPVFKECSGLHNLIYPHAILFQKFKKGKKVAVNNQELRSRRKLHWK